MRKRRRRKRREPAPFKQRLKRNLGWLIAFGAFFVTGIALFFLLPLMPKPKVSNNTQSSIENTIINRNTQLILIDSIEKIDNTNYIIISNKEEYKVTLSGIEITDGYQLGKEIYNADSIDITCIESDLYFEIENTLADNHYSGYIWFNNNETSEILTLQDDMFNAMLIYANFADWDGNNATMYASELQSIQNNRGELSKFDKKILDWLWGLFDNEELIEQSEKEL